MTQKDKKRSNNRKIRQLQEALEKQSLASTKEQQWPARFRSHIRILFFFKQTAICSIRGGKSCSFVATLICFVDLDDLFQLYDVSLTH
jgi:hypothetical protein